MDDGPLNRSAVHSHLDHLRQLDRAENTVNRRREALYRLQEWLLAMLGVADLLEVSRADLASWRATLSCPPYRPNTVRAYVTHVMGFYRWAVDEELLEVDPARRLARPKFHPGLPRPAAERDLMRAVSLAEGRVRAWLVLAGWEGLRAHSIARSAREDVLLEADPPTWLISSYAGKGSKAYSVPLANFTLEILEEFGLPRRGWNFPRLDGRFGHVSPARVTQVCNEHLRDCGVDATLHQFRHRFGSKIYRASGKDLLLTAKLMGHSSVTTTQGYAAVVDDEAVDAVNALPVVVSL
jgi:integrase